MYQEKNKDTLRKSEATAAMIDYSGVAKRFSSANLHTRTKLTRMLHIGTNIENLPGDTFVDDYLINYS